MTPATKSIAGWFCEAILTFLQMALMTLGMWKLFELYPSAMKSFSSTFGFLMAISLVGIFLLYGVQSIRAFRAGIRDGRQHGS